MAIYDDRRVSVPIRREKRRYFINEDLEWAETVFSAVLLASLLMYFVVQAFKIPSGSMESTLKIGDHLFVNKFIYGVRIPFTEKRILRLKDIQRRDIVVFRFPTIFQISRRHPHPAQGIRSGKYRFSNTHIPN